MDFDIIDELIDVSNRLLYLFIFLLNKISNIYYYIESYTVYLTMKIYFGYDRESSSNSNTEENDRESASNSDTEEDDRESLSSNDSIIFEDDDLFNEESNVRDSAGSIIL